MISTYLYKHIYNTIIEIKMSYPLNSLASNRAFWSTSSLLGGLIHQSPTYTFNQTLHTYSSYIDTTIV